MNFIFGFHVNLSDYFGGLQLFPMISEYLDLNLIFGDVFV